MVHIGNIPNSNFVNDIEKNSAKEIIADKIGQTNIPGIFAAGDVTDIPYKQISISAGLGVTAVLAAIDYINRWHE
jgi:alkyl hydroperoxide reductase subunit AhpF